MFFCGLGKLRHQTVELLVDKDVKQVTQRQRRIPFHLRAKVDAELSRLRDEDIIERVPDTEATEWISPIVIVPKKTTIFAYVLTCARQTPLLNEFDTPYQRCMTFRMS
jgi:hypothetical protein